MVGKAKVEEHIKNLYSKPGKRYAIVKPCTIFGDYPNESFVINNLAWLLRTSPIFPIPREIDGE